MKRYLPKYPLTSDDSFSSDELQKIADNIEKYEEWEWFKKYIPIVIIVALLIVYLLSRLGG
jgi:hypothetical protein